MNWLEIIINITFVLAIIITCLGLLQITFALWSYRWPIAAGKVFHVDYKKAWSNRGEVFTPKIKYEYQVNGKLYKSRRIIFGGYESTKKDKALSLINYPDGPGAIEVKYNPLCPSQSVLIPGLSRYSFILLILGVALFLFKAKSMSL